MAGHCNEQGRRLGFDEPVEKCDCWVKIALLDPPSEVTGMQTVDGDCKRNARVLAGLRISVGILFLIFGQYKVFGTAFTLGGGFEMWINRFLGGSAYPFMVPVLRGLVLSHATTIAFLVAYGELAIGLALVLGVLVRVASWFGFVFMLALLFSSNYPGPTAALWQYFGASLDHLVLALCFAAFALGARTQILSIRQYVPRPRRDRAQSASTAVQEKDVADLPVPHGKSLH
jgi:thiosulfate dehydrogenase [quinone] large subunit